MNKNRIRVVVLSAALALMLYALLGFLVLPYGAKRYLVAFFQDELGHRLALDEVRFNPFTFKAELAGIDLREPDGGPMFASRSALIDLEAASLWRRGWHFAALALDAPQLHFELRPGGRHNFSALLDALRAPEPQPDKPLPNLAIGRIALSDGRVQLADLQAGETAQLTLAPIAFELTELTTEPSDSAPYKLSARSADGERVDWQGELTLNPMASRGRLQLQDWKLATLARWLGNRIALGRADGRLMLSFDYDSRYTGGEVAFAMTDLQARLDGVALVERGSDSPFVAFESLQLDGGALDLGARNFALERIALERPAAALRIGADGSANWSGLMLRSPPQTAAATKPSSATAPATTPDPAAASVATTPDKPAPESPSAAPAAQPTTPAAAAPQPWNGRIGRVSVSDAALTFADARAESTTDVAASGLRFETSVTATHAPAASTITLSGTKSALAKLVLRLGEQQVDAAEASLEAPTIVVRLEGDAGGMDAQGLTATLASLGLQQKALGATAASLRAAIEKLELGAPAAGDLRVQGNRLSFDAGAVALRTASDAKPAIEIGSAHALADAVTLGTGAAPDLRLDALSTTIAGLAVRDPSSGNELARLEKAELAGGSLSTAQRNLALDKAMAANAHVVAVLTPDGQSNWDALLAAFNPQPTTPSGAQKPREDAAPWTTRVGAIELRDAGAAFTDRRLEPALEVELQQLNARARGYGAKPGAAMPVQVDGRIKGGGTFAAAGGVDPQTLATDLKVKLNGLPLTPLQPYVARYARVQIVSALASAEGRVRYRLPKASGGDLVFEGDVGLDKVIVEETEPAQPLLTAETVRASQAKLTLGPDALDIPDLRLGRVATRLIIGEDQSVNIVKLIRTAPQAAQPKPAAPQSEAEAKPAPAAAPEDAPDRFPVRISRVRIDNSVLEFADFSLRPQFDTRMHELQGVITGIATSARTRARMELDARVDEFGSAQIRGAMNLFRPRVFTDVNLVFRNLEMTDLSPYATKFAGYRIASGKLSADLHYRIKNSQLLGENKIVLENLELGERVESPTALDLPLELAIAILKDENGRIDLGVPVSGSLEDPQFSIAEVVWKAIGNLLGRIVTAPFRALAGMFGGSGADADELKAVRFEPGSARLPPHERTQLGTVAEALAKRPELTLTIKPTYAPKVDREALQSIAVRRAVLARAGIKLEAGEAPGPLDYGNARIRRAVEDIFSEAFGFPAARDLRASLAKQPRKSAPDAGDRTSGTSANPGAAMGNAKLEAPAQPQGQGDANSAASGSSAAAASDDASTAAPAAPPPANVRVARAMLQRLIAAHPVADSELTQLGQSRGEAVASALLGSGKLDAARVATAAPRAIEDAEHAVATELDLGVAKQERTQ